MNDITKLPKWAQSRIAALENHERALKAELSALSIGDGSISWSTAFMEPHGIPNNAGLKFAVPGGSITARIDGNDVEILAYAGLGYSFILIPHASNHVSLAFKKD